MDSVVPLLFDSMNTDFYINSNFKLWTDNKNVKTTGGEDIYFVQYFEMS